jgi:hypothetical protein
MSQWYLSYDGKQTGPMGQQEASVQSRSNPNGYAWREGFGNWLPIPQVPELATDYTPAPPPPSRVKADAIDYKIMGTEMQFVEVELDPGESALAEAGAMMYKDAHVDMQTIFGDGSTSGGGGGFLDKLLGAGKRILTGESLFMTVFTHQGKGKGRIAFGAPYPGNILPISLPDVGGSLACQKEGRGVHFGGLGQLH